MVFMSRTKTPGVCVSKCIYCFNELELPCREVPAPHPLLFPSVSSPCVGCWVGLCSVWQRFCPLSIHKSQHSKGCCRGSVQLHLWMLCSCRILFLAFVVLFPSIRPVLPVPPRATLSCLSEIQILLAFRGAPGVPRNNVTVWDGSLRFHGNPTRSSQQIELSRVHLSK